MDFGDQRLHKLSAFRIIHHGVQLIKVNQNFADIIGSQLFPSIAVFFALASISKETPYPRFLSLHLVKAIIKVCLAFDVVFIHRGQRYQFLLQSIGI